VYRATPADIRLIETIRLNALRDSPGAFLSGPADHPEPGHDDWLKVVTEWTLPPDNAVFVATSGETGVGMCGAFVSTPVRATLVALWVVPALRGSPVASRLVEQVLDFARNRGVADVGAWVVEDNYRAMRFYRKHGFEPDGTRRTFDPEPDKDELLIVRAL